MNVPANAEADAAPVPGTEVAPELLRVLRCPENEFALTWNTATRMLESSTGAPGYEVRDGIPRLFVPNTWPEGRRDVTAIVKDFYEETPFPNYDDLDSRDSLMRKARQGLFAKLLDAQLPRPALVLEAGCGTGQLSNFLGMGWKRTVIGGDVCVNSLTLAKRFRDHHSINNAHFIQMNLFRPPFADATFDVIVSNGVLHHTSDPKGGFKSLVRKLKPDGLVLIGLYNALGRLPTLWRRRMIELFGNRFAALDSRLRRSDLNAGRWQAWFRDQYKHPHESKHTMDEVLRWFGESGIEPLASIPMAGGVTLGDGTRLFSRNSMGSHLDRWGVQLNMLVEGGDDGGLFIMVGRKKSPGSERVLNQSAENREL